MLKKSGIIDKIKLESRINKGITIDDIVLLFQIHKQDIRRLKQHGKYFDMPRTRYFRQRGYLVSTPHLSAKATIHDRWFEYTNGVHYFHEQVCRIHWCRNDIDSQTHYVGSYDFGPLLSVGACSHNRVRTAFNKIAKLYTRTHN